MAAVSLTESELSVLLRLCAVQLAATARDRTPAATASSPVVAVTAEATAAARATVSSIACLIVSFELKSSFNPGAPQGGSSYGAQGGSGYGAPPQGGSSYSGGDSAAQQGSYGGQQSGSYGQQPQQGYGSGGSYGGELPLTVG